MRVNKLFLTKFGMTNNEAEKVLGFLKTKIVLESKQIRNELGKLYFHLHFDSIAAVKALKKAVESLRVKNKNSYLKAIEILEPLGEK